jgi:hypothetical protein
MIYHGTDFNEEVVKKMSKKQFLNLAQHGNRLTPKQLAEVYDLILTEVKKNENSKQYDSGSESN